jgi:hypothetical protein
MSETKPRAFDVYEKDGKFYFNGGDGNPFGPYDDKDEAEMDSTQAEATW